MSDPTSALDIIQSVGGLGTGVIIFIIWYFDQKELARKEKKTDDLIAEFNKVVAAAEVRHRDSMAKIELHAKEFQAHVDKRIQAQTQMYTNNVSLVKRYAETSEELQNIIVLCTQAMTKMVTMGEHNLFCPLVRKESGRGENGNES